MIFFSSDRHARLEAVDQQVDTLAARFSDDSLVAAVGPDFAATVESFTADYHVPNYRHGRLSLTDKQRALGGHLILAVDRNEDVYLDESFLFPSDDQIEAVEAEYGLTAASNYIDTLRSMATKSVPTNLAKEKAAAMVMRRFAEIDDPDSKQRTLLLGRGVIVTGMLADSPFSATGEYLAHELVHDEQVRSTPILRRGVTIRDNGLDCLLDENDPYITEVAMIGARAESGATLSYADLATLQVPELIQTILTTPCSVNSDPLQEFDRQLEGITRELLAAEQRARAN